MKNKYKAKPFVKWVGGKTQLLSEIKSRLPKRFDTSSDIIYVEPFVGGGALLFWILQEFPNIKKAVINDINPDLTNAYRVIKETPDKLILLLDEIQNEYISSNEESRKEMFLRNRELYNTKDLDAITNAALFLFLNRTCFNGLYRVNSKGLFNVPFGKYKNPKICDKETIMADSELLQKVEILTGDFSNTLKCASENSFFYFDPPYKPLTKSSSFNSYAKESFDDLEQIRLRDFCNTLTENKTEFILSNSDVKAVDNSNDFFDQLYSLYNINRVLASRFVNANVAKRGKLNELLITNSIV